MIKYFFASILFFLVFTSINAQSSEMLFERIESLSNEEKVEQHNQAIKNVFKLPYELSFITGSIMQEINDYKSINCPNYPEEVAVERNSFKQSLLEWVANYPDEYMNYMRKIYEEINKYSN